MFQLQRSARLLDYDRPRTDDEGDGNVGACRHQSIRIGGNGTTPWFCAHVAMQLPMRLRPPSALIVIEPCLRWYSASDGRPPHLWTAVLNVFFEGQGGE